MVDDDYDGLRTKRYDIIEGKDNRWFVKRVKLVYRTVTKIDPVKEEFIEFDVHCTFTGIPCRVFISNGVHEFAVKLPKAIPRVKRGMIFQMNEVNSINMIEILTRHVCEAEVIVFWAMDTTTYHLLTTAKDYVNALLLTDRYQRPN